MSQESRGSMTRRQFAQTTAAAGFAILASRSGVAQSNGDTLTFGIIGTGGRGYGAGMNMLQGADNVKLVGLADVFDDKVNSARERYEAIEDPNMAGKVDIDPDKCFTGLDAYKQLIDTDVDIIVHATPPYIRSVHIEAAVDAGKHIFTEKPAAVDPVGIRRFIRAAEKAEEKGLSMVCGFQRRYQTAYVDTISQIKDGAVGDILAARAYWNGSLPFSHEREDDMSDLEYRLRNWYNYCWVCGDNIVEQHIHNLDVINWIMGEPPVAVVASGGRAWKPKEERYGDIWDNFSCDFEYANGVHMLSMARHWNNSHSAVFEEVTGTEGVSTCRDMAEDKGDPYVHEHTHLVNSIRGDEPYLNNGVAMAHSTMTAIMGRMAAYTGQRMTWDEAINSDLSLVPEELDFDNEYPVGPIPVPGS